MHARRAHQNNRTPNRHARTDTHTNTNTHARTRPRTQTLTGTRAGAHAHVSAGTITRRARTWARSLTPCGPRGHAHTHTLARRYGQQHAARQRARVCPGVRRRIYAAELAHSSCGYGAYGWRRRCSRSDSEGALARDNDSGSAPTAPCVVRLPCGARCGLWDVRVVLV